MLAQRPSVANVSFAGSETLRGGYLCEWMPLSTGVYSVSVLIRVTNHPTTPGTRTWMAAPSHVQFALVLDFCFYIKHIPRMYKCISCNVSMPPQVPCSTSRDPPFIRSVTLRHRTTARCSTSDVFNFNPATVASSSPSHLRLLYSYTPNNHAKGARSRCSQ